jgi:uncharacterized membrane protein YbhN (UPF0104 family)
MIREITIKVRRILPWLIAAVLLYILFQNYPVKEVLAATSYVNFFAFTFFILVYFCYMTFADSWGLQQILNNFGISISFNKVLKLRLASYLPMILNYSVGQGVMAYLIKSQHNEPLAKVGSILLYIMLADMYLVLSFAFCGSLFVDDNFNRQALLLWIRSTWSGASLLLIAMFFLRQFPLIERKIEWLKTHDLFYFLQKANISDYLKVLLWRLPWHCAASTYFYFLALCFGVNIPFLSVMTLLPLTIAVEAIPITPAGIGTVQFMAIFLFQDHVSGGPLANDQIAGAEIVLAMSILFAFSMYCLKLFFGAIFWGHLKKAQK